MKKVTITSEKAINEHFDTRAERIRTTAMQSAKERLLADNEVDRQKALAIFWQTGELRVYENGAQWEVIEENKMLTIRKRSGLSQAKFGEKYGIPKRTIESWEMGERECPGYVMSLLDRVVNEDFA